MKKYITPVLSFICMVSVLFFAFSNSSIVRADTSSDTQTMIVQVQQQLITTLQQLIQLKISEGASISGGVSAAITNSTTVATPAVAPWCYTFTSMLRSGAHGSDVAALQIILKKEGFTVSSSEVRSQKFGSSTSWAVTSFQKKYHLSPLSAYVGNATLAQLNKLYGCPVVVPAPTPVPTPAPTPIPTPVPVPVPPVCTSNWQCTTWNTCSNSQQTRTCTDANACATTTNKPSETQTCIPTPAPTPVPVPTPVPPVTTTTKMWGAYTGDTYSSFSSFQQQVGKQANINAIFIGWNDPFPTSLANSLKSNNQTLLIYWEQYGVTLDQINSGSSDSYIQKFAADAKASGAKIIMAPLHEMNGNWDPWDGTMGNNTPAKVITAFKHIHDLFVGNSNVTWGWAVNNESVPNTSANAITSYYPGDAYVDYVGVDGFNFANPWQSYSTVFSSALQTLKTYHKPIFIFSMASASGSQKSAWISDALSQIYANPDIAGWIWFNENKEQNWLISSDSGSLQSFQTGIR